MIPKKAGRPKLTEAERIGKREKQKERLLLKLAKIRSAETRAARKERARDLIKIGSIISQYHDVKDLIKYLENPKYITIIDGKVSVINEKPNDKKAQLAIFLRPDIAPKKD